MNMLIAQERLRTIFDNVPNRAVVVVGDVMVDEYLWGLVERISPEAPVPVVDLQEQSFRLGGAANVAWNLVTFGVKTHLIGVVGDDTSAKVLRQELERKGISDAGLIVDKNRHTTRKTRVIAHSQQVVRIDRENREPVSPEIEDQILKIFRQVLDESDGVIISDYFKGVVTERVVKGIIQEARIKGKFIAVDPKERHFMYFRGVNVITPNQKEAGVIVGEKLTTDKAVYEAGWKILNMLEVESVLITRGEKGMTLFERNGEITHFPAVAKEVYDVTGAGDTVISVFTACAVSGATLKESALISNYAAGIVVGELGTAAVRRDELLKEMVG
jgi:D-beta-D-heptose 7-phosphate kinase/D-beta-D-heptose 1-phosphate adenosyltransferase